MMISIAATSRQQAQLMAKGIPASAKISWVAGTTALLNENGDALIDCTFCGTEIPLTNKPFLIHSPVNTLKDLQAKGRVGRFCAWDTFIERTLWDVAITDSTDVTWINTLMNELIWKFCVVQDKPGLIAPRIVCNIINEARHALHAGISTKQEIDLAMKLGTNYPYGPFEWASKIGIDNIDTLLARLAIQQSFYQPAEVKFE